MTTDKLQVFKFGDGAWDPSHRFVTSWLVSPWALFAIRASISLYAFFVLLFAIFWEIAQLPNGGATARFSFSYFTILCYWGISFYFFFAALHTFTYARSGIPLLSRFPRPLQALHALYYSTIICYPILVTIVFWGVIFRVSVPVGWFPTTFDAWSNISEHGLNSLFALFEICIPRTPSPPWFHLLWLIVILACYLGLAYITVATKHQYVYSFLNPKVAQHGMVAAYVFGIAVGICLIFAVVKGAVSLRVWVTETKGGRRGKFAKVGELQIADVEMQRFEGKA